MNSRIVDLFMRVFSKRTPSQLGRCRYPRADVLFDAALVIVLLAACVLVVKNPLRYVADDALFYYQIALNIVAGRGVVFSLMPTNGFHPLWEAVCTLVAWVAPSKAAFQYFIALTGLGLNIAGLSMLRIAMARAQIPYPSAFIMLGAPYVLFVTQGMEGSLTVALLCSILVAFQRYSIRNVFSQLVLLYFLVGLLVLARLDLAILLIPVCLYIAFRHVLVRRSRPGAREVAVALAIAVTPLILYLLFNYVYFGDFRPISGLLKVANASRHYRNHSFTGVVSLYLGLSVVGSLFSCIEGTDWSRLILFLTAGLVLYAFYVLRLTSEAYAWYFYSFAVVAVCALGGVARSIGSSVPAATGVFRRHCLSAAPLALAIAACAFGVFLLHRYGKPVWRLPFDSYLGDNDLGGSARRVGIRRALVFDRPGEIAFLHGLDVVAADGLTTNLQFQRELAVRGMGWAIAKFDIQALIIPKLGGIYTDQYCDIRYLNVIRFLCAGSDRKRIYRVDFFSRLTGESIGGFDIDDYPRLSFSPDRDLEVVLLRRAAAPAPRRM